MLKLILILALKVESAPSTAGIDKTSNLRVAVEKKELGNEAYRKGRYDEALAFYDEAIELDPSQICFYNNKGGG
jgi:tetratricopeptide (TPR) repeat protein